MLEGNTSVQLPGFIMSQRGRERHTSFNCDMYVRCTALHVHGTCYMYIQHVHCVHVHMYMYIVYMLHVHVQNPNMTDNKGYPI